MCLLAFLALFLTIVVSVVMAVFSFSLPVALLVVFLAFVYWACTPEKN